MRAELREVSQVLDDEELEGDELDAAAGAGADDEDADDDAEYVDDDSENNGCDAYADVDVEDIQQDAVVRW